MKPLIISLGQPLRGDDAFGPCVVSALRPTVRDRADFFECNGDMASLLDLWRDRSQVFIIDACQAANAQTGDIYRLDGLTETLPPDSPSASSHALGISSTIEMGKLMGALPRSLIIYTVVGNDFSLGAPISAGVENAVPAVARRIANEIATG